MRIGHFNHGLVYNLLHHQKVMPVGEFARRMGVSGKTVSSWIKPGGSPAQKRLATMAAVLGVDESELWVGDPSSEASKDMYERRLLELIDGQPEHMKAEAVSAVARRIAEESARRRNRGDP